MSQMYQTSNVFIKAIKHIEFVNIAICTYIHYMNRVTESSTYIDCPVITCQQCFKTLVLHTELMKQD